VAASAGLPLVPVVATLVASAAALSRARSEYDRHVRRALGRPDDLDTSGFLRGANRLHGGE
jgi:hypothetical protein